MSQDEETATRGRLVTTYADIRTWLATLETEATRIGKQLEGIGHLLQTHPECVVFAGQKVTGRHPEVRAFEPITNDAARIPDLVDEIRRTRTDLERLRQRLEELDLDV